jgi:hypothetical protein
MGTVADSWFPIELSTFTRAQYDDFPPTDYLLGVPHELTRPIDADGQHHQALVLVGPAASPNARAAIELVITSLTFPPLHTGEEAGDEAVLPQASTYDVRGDYRSACHLRLDSHDDQLYCTNSPARWDRTGRPLRVPHGAKFADALHFAFAKIAWDGHVVFLPGLGGDPLRAKARAVLWPGRA